MTYEVVFHPVALDHLACLYRYIAKQSYPKYAEAFVESIVQYCESFRTLPPRGTRTQRRSANVRTIGFRRRVTIAFSVEDTTVEVLGIYYRGQDVGALLDLRTDL